MLQWISRSGELAHRSEHRAGQSLGQALKGCSIQRDSPASLPPAAAVFAHPQQQPGADLPSPTLLMTCTVTCFPIFSVLMQHRGLQGLGEG